MFTYAYFIKSRFTSLVLLVWFLFQTTAFSSAVAAPELNLLFDGYYKIIINGIHSGYTIQRYELDPKKKLFIGKYYTYLQLGPSRDGKPAKFQTESLVAVSNDRFAPVSLSYTLLRNDTATEIITHDAQFTPIVDGKFKKGALPDLKVVITGNHNKKVIKETKKIPGGTFLSNFLLYLAMEKGFKVDRKFEFKTLIEDDLTLCPGILHIRAEKEFSKIPSYQIALNLTRAGIDGADVNEETIAYVSKNGHVLSSTMPKNSVEQLLVADKSEAIQGFPHPDSTIKKIFGVLPEGRTNTMSSPPKVSTTPLVPSPKKTDDDDDEGD